MDGAYHVYAQVDADQFVAEGNEDNNVAGPQTVLIGPNADLDIDGDVDGNDLAIFIDAFGLTENDADFNERYDFDLNGTIDETDLAAFSPHFGRTDCPCIIE
jgi:hypothetical protein